MKPKHLLILGVILGVLVLGVIAKQFVKPPEIATEEYAPLELSFDEARVSKIEIKKGREEKLVELIKEGEKWRVANFLNARADQDKIREFIKMLREAKGELRAKDKSLFGDFSISEEQAYSILLSDEQGALLFQIFLGEKKPKYDAVFLRKGDSEMVYYVDRDIFGQMGLWGDPTTERPKREHWASLRILDSSIDQIQRLEVRRFLKGKGFVSAGIFREVDPNDPSKKRWKFLRETIPFALDAEKVKQFLNSLKDWKATQVLDPAGKDFDFSKPEWQMRLSLEGGGEIVLSKGKVDEATREPYLQVSGDAVIFRISDYTLKNMDIDDSRFFIENPLEVAPEKTEKVVIRADRKKIDLSPKKKKDEAVNTYLEGLKTLAVARLLFDGEEKKVTSPSRFSLEIQKEGTPLQVLEVGEVVSEEKKEYAARMRHSPQAFAISEAFYKKVFDNLDRFK